MSDPLAAASQIDTLISRYPGLRRIILRELLVPSRAYREGDSFWQRGPYAAPFTGIPAMTPFERMGLIVRRSAELDDRRLSNRIFAPEVNLIDAITWRLGLGR